MSHLTILMSMFPNQMFLSVDDIAKLLNVSKGHIYNLSSKDKLPFKLLDVSDKIQVSIIEMGRYLDSKLEDKQEEKRAVEPSVPSLIKRKGRPRNSSKIQLAFQGQLKIAIVEYEFNQIFMGMSHEIEQVQFSEDGSCLEKFDGLKAKALELVKSSQITMNHSFLALNLGLNGRVGVVKKKPVKV